MTFIRFTLLLLSCFLLNGCGEEAPERPAPVPASQQSSAKGASPAALSTQTSTSAGGVTVQILPENPTSTGCLRAFTQGSPGRSGYRWSVNGERVAGQTGGKLCNDHYKRYDLVEVEVGTSDIGARASVSIGNSPPRVVDISSTPQEIFTGADISVTPVAEDIDDDMVDFTYQWLINGIDNPLLIDATLPGDKFTKGDTVQVLIVPNDFFVDGPTYESYAQTVPNAAPQITSEPPQGITSLDYRYQVEVLDPDDTQFAYRLDEAPEGMTIDEASGLIKWPLAGVAPGVYTIAIIAADPDGAETAQEYSLTLGAPE